MSSNLENFSFCNFNFLNPRFFQIHKFLTVRRLKMYFNVSVQRIVASDLHFGHRGFFFLVISETTISFLNNKLCHIN